MNVTLNFFLIPLYGINGAAFATALSLIFGVALGFSVVYMITGIHPFKLSYLKPVFSSIIAVSIVYGITKYILGVSHPVLIIMFFVFLALYFFLLLFFKSFEEEDLMIMRAIEERTGMRWELARRVIGRFL